MVSRKLLLAPKKQPMMAFLFRISQRDYRKQWLYAYKRIIIKRKQLLQPESFVLGVSLVIIQMVKKSFQFLNILLIDLRIAVFKQSSRLCQKNQNVVFSFELCANFQDVFTIVQYMFGAFFFPLHIHILPPRLGIYRILLPIQMLKSKFGKKNPWIQVIVYS